MSTNGAGCPLGDLRRALKDALEFYRTKGESPRDGRFQTAWKEGNHPTLRQLDQIKNGVLSELEVGDERWRRIDTPPHVWTPAPDDENVVNPSFCGALQQPQHLHTTLIVGSRTIHVDVIKQSSGGPGSGLQDFQFFENREFVSRGGFRFVAPGVFYRGWPPAARFGKYLLLADRHFPGGLLPKYEGLSLWKQIQTDTVEKNADVQSQ